jgi:hypothetical protein
MGSREAPYTMASRIAAPIDLRLRYPRPSRDCEPNRDAAQHMHSEADKRAAGQVHNTRVTHECGPKRDLRVQHHTLAVPNLHAYGKSASCAPASSCDEKPFWMNSQRPGGAGSV